MKLYVPSLGDKLVLTKPWRFKLYGEWRNDTLFKALSLPFPMESGRRSDGTEWQCRAQNGFVTATLPVGTELKVARIYIRNGQKDFDSITFSAAIMPKHWPRGLKKPLKPARVRFWAKLRDCDGIEFERGEA